MSLDAIATSETAPEPVTEIPATETDHSLSQLSEVVGRTSYGIVEIAGALDTVDDRARQQLSVLETVTRAATEAHAANTRVQDVIRDVVSRSGGTLDAVTRSVNDMQLGATAAQDLAAWVRSVHDQVQVLGNALQSVQADNNKIASIAANVNILAINAGIEAARAGDAGRGFAVVADAINDLSKKTSAAAADISENVAELSQKVDALRNEADAMAGTAQKLQNNAAETDEALAHIAARVADTQKDASHIAQEAESVQKASDELLPGFDKLASSARATCDGVDEARKEAHALIDDCELLVQITADYSPETPDMEMVALAQAKASEIGHLFETAISRGYITEDNLFSTSYTPLPHSDPQQVMAPFTRLTDRLLPPLQEPVLLSHPQVVFCAAVNRQGYLPTHNQKFSHKQTKDVDWNAANCRNRRIFDDRVGLKSGQNTRPFLLQVYRRDMGGGAYRMMKDLSAPIFVNGTHWGGFRIGYSS